MIILFRLSGVQRLFLSELPRLLAVGSPDWWAQVESNHRPHAYQACALTF